MFPPIYVEKKLSWNNPAIQPTNNPSYSPLRKPISTTAINNKLGFTPTIAIAFIKVVCIINILFERGNINGKMY